MPDKKPSRKNVQGLAKSLRKNQADARVEHGGKSAPGAGVGRDTPGTAGDAQPVSPLVRLIQSLGQEKIRFQIVGMMAVTLQGVIMTTIDTDIWVDLPERQYIRLMNLCVKQGATALAPTLYVLSDGSLINFLFRVDGVGSFDVEYKNAVSAKIEGEKVKLLPLEKILKSKKAIRRDKDEAHIFAIERFLKARKKSEKKP